MDYKLDQTSLSWRLFIWQKEKLMRINWYSVKISIHEQAKKPSLYYSTCNFILEMHDKHIKMIHILRRVVSLQELLLRKEDESTAWS